MKALFPALLLLVAVNAIRAQESFGFKRFHVGMTRAEAVRVIDVEDWEYFVGDSLSLASGSRGAVTIVPSVDSLAEFVCIDRTGNEHCYRMRGLQIGLFKDRVYSVAVSSTRYGVREQSQLQACVNAIYESLTSKYGTATTIQNTPEGALSKLPSAGTKTKVATIATWTSKEGSGEREIDMWITYVPPSKLEESYYVVWVDFDDVAARLMLHFVQSALGEGPVNPTLAQHPIGFKGFMVGLPRAAAVQSVYYRGFHYDIGDSASFAAGKLDEVALSPTALSGFSGVVCVMVDSARGCDRIATVHLGVFDDRLFSVLVSSGNFKPTQLDQLQGAVRRFYTGLVNEYGEPHSTPNKPETIATEVAPRMGAQDYPTIAEWTWSRDEVPAVSVTLYLTFTPGTWDTDPTYDVWVGYYDIDAMMRKADAEESASSK